MKRNLKLLRYSGNKSKYEGNIYWLHMKITQLNYDNCLRTVL
jgi:hypothetical protein